MMWLIKFKLIGPPSREWTITSIFLIREPPSPEGEPYEDDFVALDHSLIDIRGDWKQDVRRFVPGHWDAWKVEIRAIRGHTKRRLIVRHDEDMNFDRDICRNDKIISSAYLHTPTSSINITSKARKYATHPNRRVKAHDFFVFDDYDTLRGCVVEVRYLERTGKAGIDRYRFE